MHAVPALIASSALALAALWTAPAAAAAAVGDGTLTVAALYNPTVVFGASSGSFMSTSGTTFEVSGTGAFANSTGLMGDFNGTLNFSETVGQTIDQSVPDFFTFQDGSGGDFEFSVASVQDLTYSNNPGVSSAASLYILGTTNDPFLSLTDSPTSLTLSFDSNGGSAYSASATLSVPPVSSAPEPSTWILMIAGFALVGGALRFGNQRRGVLAAA